MVGMSGGGVGGGYGYGGGIGVGGQLQHPHMAVGPPTILGAANSLMYQTNHLHMQNGNYHQKPTTALFDILLWTNEYVPYGKPYACSRRRQRRRRVRAVLDFRTNWTSKVSLHTKQLDGVCFFLSRGYFCVCVRNYYFSHETFAHSSKANATREYEYERVFSCVCVCMCV